MNLMSAQTATPASQTPAVPTPPPAQPSSSNSSHAADPYTNYMSNPFLNSIRGLVLALRFNPTPSLLSGLIGLFVGIGVLAISMILAIVVHINALAYLGMVLGSVVLILSKGAYYVIAGSSAREEGVTTKQAFSKSAKKFLPFVGLNLLYSLITVIGFVFLIVPGIIILARGSLSALVLFEENLGPIQALKRSFALTKGHVTEMIGAMFASGFLGRGGLLMGVIGIAPLVGRYHDLRNLEQVSNATKPKVHWLNYLAYVVFILTIVGIALLVVLALKANPNKLTNSTNFTYRTDSNSVTVADWFNINRSTYNSNVSYFNNDLKQLQADTPSLAIKNKSLVKSDCELMKTDLKLAQQMSAIPDVVADGYYQDFLNSFGAVANDCMSAVNGGKTSLPASINSDAQSASSSLTKLEAQLKTDGLVFSN